MENFIQRENAYDDIDFNNNKKQKDNEVNHEQIELEL